MSTVSCGNVQDLLPEHARGVLEPALAASLDAHLESCGACSTESALVSLLARHPAMPTTALEARIIGAVRTAPARRPQPWIARHAALAAALAGALLTGGLWLRQVTPDPAAERQPQVSLVEEAVLNGALTWITEPVLSGGPALHELSMDELEALLMELES
jgi:anti-sigma factor RsiW